MARTKGSKNQNSSALPDYATLPVEQRIEILANLIVDKIYEDLQSDQAVLSQLQGNGNA